MNAAPMKQSDMMRKLFTEHAGDRASVCAAYIRAHQDGLVIRKSNVTDQTIEAYAGALFMNGKRKGWFA